MPLPLKPDRLHHFLRTYNVAIFGGTAEFIALWLKSIGMESLFYFYVAGCIAISFITYWRMDESSKTSQIEAELGGGDTLANNKSS